MLISGFPYLDLSLDYRPERIRFHHEMEFFSLLYETIFFHDKYGNIKSNILENFYWKNGYLNLEFKKDLQMSNSMTWGAKDAYYSLLRLVILNQNTHGHLKSFLCPHDKPKSLHDKCKGLTFKKNLLRVKVKKGQVKILLELMSTHELSIVPFDVIDPSSLKIKSFEVTTGIYSLVRINHQESSITLNKNQYYTKRTSCPSVIILKGFSIYESESVKDIFINAKIDILPTYTPVEKSKLYLYGKKDKLVNMHLSEPINLTAVVFSPFSKIEVKRRVKIFKKLKNFYHEEFFIKNFHKQSSQLFSQLGELSLDNTFLEKIEKEWKNTDESNEDGEGLSFKLRTKSSKSKFYRELIKNIFPKITIVENDSFAFSSTDNSDFTIISTDTGLHEHYSLIAYFASSQMFQFKSKKQEEKWFETYANEENKEVRLRMAKEKHFESLMNGYALPIYLSPYVALAKKPWKLDLPKIYAGTPLWRIYRE